MTKGKGNSGPAGLGTATGYPEFDSVACGFPLMPEADSVNSGAPGFPGGESFAGELGTAPASIQARSAGDSSSVDESGSRWASAKKSMKLASAGPQHHPTALNTVQAMNAARRNAVSKQGRMSRKNIKFRPENLRHR